MLNYDLALAIKNSKFESRNSKPEYKITEIQTILYSYEQIYNFEGWNIYTFEFRICFEFRVSFFGFIHVWTGIKPRT